jgi:hypothetical protein
MKCIVVSRNQNALLCNFEKHGYQVKELVYGDGTPGYQLYLNIEAEEPDLFVTLDLAGFTIKTDTDNIAYINLTCPSLHFISSAVKQEELACLAEKLSMAMFFYCQSQETYQYLQENCTEIPYLKEVADIEDALEDWVKQ